MNRYLEKVAAMTDEDKYKISRNAALISGMALSGGVFAKRLASKTMTRVFSGKADTSWKINTLKSARRKASKDSVRGIDRKIGKYQALMDRQDGVISRYRKVRDIGKKSLYPSGAILAGSTGSTAYFRSKRDPYAEIRSIGKV